MNDELESLSIRVRDQGRHVSALFETTDPAKILRRPTPTRWSVVEHVFHVTLTDVPYVERIDAALRKGREDGRLGGGPYRGAPIGNWFARTMEPPPKRRLRTTRELEPPMDLDPDAVEAEFRSTRERLIASLAAAEGLDLDALRIGSPFLALLRMPVSSAFRVLVAHGDRHLWLAEEALGQVG
jgi:hypothetical protein